MLSTFKTNETLYTELTGPGDGPGATDKLPAIVALAEKIALIETECAGAIKELERETKEMIGLVSFVISDRAVT